MTCNLINEKLDDYVDAQLDVADMHSLDEHTAQCADCQEILDRESASEPERIRRFQHAAT